MTETNNRFTIIFIKPDAINDGLVESIVSDFVEAGLKFIHLKPIELTLEQATLIYKDHVDSLNFKFAIDSLVREGECKTVLFLLAKREEGDALSIAQQTKGRADVSGIRAKYRRYLREDLTKKGIEGDGLKTLLSRNRLHIPDSNEHVCEIMEMVLKPEELGVLMKLDPEFRSFIENFQQSKNIESGRNNLGKERI